MDEPTSEILVKLNNSVKAVNAAKIPLAVEVRRQLSEARADLAQVKSTVDAVMDREETRLLIRTLPSRSGLWQFAFHVDKITDEQQVQALTEVEGRQAKYQLTMVCGSSGSELLISTFETGNTRARREFHGISMMVLRRISEFNSGLIPARPLRPNSTRAVIQIRDKSIFNLTWAALRKALDLFLLIFFQMIRSRWRLHFQFSLADFANF